MQPATVERSRGCCSYLDDVVDTCPHSQCSPTICTYPYSFLLGPLSGAGENLMHRTWGPSGFRPQALTSQSLSSQSSSFGPWVPPILPQPHPIPSQGLRGTPPVAQGRPLTLYPYHPSNLYQNNMFAILLGVISTKKNSYTFCRLHEVHLHLFSAGLSSLAPITLNPQLSPNLMFAYSPKSHVKVGAGWRGEGIYQNREEGRAHLMTTTMSWEPEKKVPPTINTRSV